MAKKENKEFQVLNESNFQQITEGLDQMEAARTLRLMGDDFNTASDLREPDAIAMINDLYPDYAVGGKDEGKQFEHNGAIYQLQVTREWDFGNISGTAELHRLEQKRDAIKRESAAITKALKQAKETVLNLHPDWKPANIKVALKYIRR